MRGLLLGLSRSGGVLAAEGANIRRAQFGGEDAAVPNVG